MSAVALFTATLVAEVLRPEPLIDAVEAAFTHRGRGQPNPGGVLGVEMAAGGFHLKAAALSADRGVFAAKLNGNFPGNPAANGMPTIQGLMIVADVCTGAPLAIMDSGSVTRLRTAAATAVAIKHLANTGADQLTIIGCGVQAYDHIRFAHVVRPLRRVVLVDAQPEQAQRLAIRVVRELGMEISVGADVASACAESEIIITCTTSRAAFLERTMVPPGAFVAAVGADNPHKSELAAALLANAQVITDSTAQCAEIGDLRHAITSGVMTAANVHAELGEVVAGVRPGRESASQRIVFDSTGLPIQDAAAAQLALTLAASRTDLPHFRLNA